MFQNFVSNHNNIGPSRVHANSVIPTYPPALIPASIMAARDSLFVVSNLSAYATAGGNGFGLIIAVDDGNYTDNQVFSFGCSLAISNNHNFTVTAVRFESASVPAAFPLFTAMTYFSLLGNNVPGNLNVKDCVTISTKSLTGNKVYVGLLVSSTLPVPAGTISGLLSINQVNKEVSVLQPLK